MQAGGHGPLAHLMTMRFLRIQLRHAETALLQIERAIAEIRGAIEKSSQILKS